MSLTTRTLSLLSLAVTTVLTTVLAAVPAQAHEEPVASLGDSGWATPVVVAPRALTPAAPVESWATVPHVLLLMAAVLAALVLATIAQRRTAHLRSR
jgi:hypothetical protein